MWVLLLFFCCMNSLYFSSSSLNICSSASWEHLKDHSHICTQTWQYFSPFYTKGMVSSHRVCWKNSRLIWRRVRVLSLRNSSLHITRVWDLFGSTLCIINRNPKRIEFHSLKCQDKEECWSDPKHGPAFLFAVRSTHINILVSQEPSRRIGELCSPGRPWAPREQGPRVFAKHSTLLLRQGCSPCWCSPMFPTVALIYKFLQSLSCSHIYLTVLLSVFSRTADLAIKKIYKPIGVAQKRKKKSL